MRYWKRSAALIAASMAAMAILWSCASPPEPSAEAELSPSSTIAAPKMQDDTPRKYAGLHNVVAFADDVYSGSVPEGAAGFGSLRALGVQTIISVDGAAPEVDRAAAEGMRYVHLPIGYNGMDESRKLELARALRDLPGPIYVHCHHGKHRSAAAAGAALVSLGSLSNAEAHQRMKVSGTSPKYTGLYGCVAVAAPVDEAALDQASNEFPERYQTSGMVKSMVEIDRIFAHLKAIEKAGWTTPRDHPDLVPAAEAGRLADVLRYLLEDEEVRDQPADFIAMMQQNQREASALETGIVNGVTGDALSRQFAQIDATCNACHVKYRN